MKVRTRFAPSPTGFMHIGNLRTALYGYLFAKHNNGDFILRIEDTDQERYVDGAIRLIYSSLKKANIIHDEGPDVGGSVAPYIQSERKEIYRKYAHLLVEKGGAYYCFCDKTRLDSLSDDKGIKKYDKHCLHLSKEEIAELLKTKPYVIRQNMPTTGVSSYEDLVFGTISVPCADMEDNILLKSDGMPTYNFANVVDDHLMGITHVMRGTEYLSSTPKYNLIYQSFGWEQPIYMHLPPIMKDATRKLSKRYGDANFEDFLAKGYLAHAIVNYIALLGWSPKDNQEKMTMQQLIDNFGVDGISKSASIFDENKMKWLNSLYIKEMDFATFCEYAKPFYDQSKIANKYDYDKFSHLLQSRIEIFSQIPSAVNFIEEFGAFDTALFEHKKLKIDREIAKLAIKAGIEVFSSITDIGENTVELLAEKSQELGIKKGQVLYCLRLALTATQVTPGGAIEMADILGIEESLSRLQFSLQLFD